MLKNLFKKSEQTIQPQTTCLANQNDQCVLIEQIKDLQDSMPPLDSISESIENIHKMYNLMLGQYLTDDFYKLKTQRSILTVSQIDYFIYSLERIKNETIKIEKIQDEINYKYKQIKELKSQLGIQ